MANAALQVVNLHVWYAQSHVLDGITLHAMPGEIIVLLGRKGSGRSMMLRTIFGEAAIYPEFTSEENLFLPTSEHDSLGGGMSLHQIYALCPPLAEVRQTLAGRLEAAQQRMLAIARVLRSGASVLLMDNISENLEPDMRDAMAQLLDCLRDEGYAMILAENTLDFATGLADRFYVLDQGRVIDSFTAGELPTRRRLLHHLLCESRPGAQSSASDSLRAAPSPR